jgi:hypothetical protein
VRSEVHSALLPPAHVAPGEVREAAPAVRDVPTVEPPRVLGDREADGAEAVRREDGEGVLAQAAVGIVEGDRELPWPHASLAAYARRELVQSERAPSGIAQPFDLAREAARRDAGDAQLASPLDLVVAEDRWQMRRRGRRGVRRLFRPLTR